MTLVLDKNRECLDSAIHKLEALIQSIVEKPRNIATEGATQHLIELNKQLNAENTELKEQLFTELKNINLLRESNKTVQAQIENLITKLEKMVN